MGMEGGISEARHGYHTLLPTICAARGQRFPLSGLFLFLFDTVGQPSTAPRNAAYLACFGGEEEWPGRCTTK